MRSVGFKDPSKIVHGIDVSAWQGDVDMSHVKVQSAFTFMKATEGVSYLSANFYPEWLDENNGIIRGAYHYFKYGIDPVAQAEYFLSKVNLEVGDLPLMCDWEDPQAQLNRDMVAYGESALIFMDIIEKRTGLKPFFYTYPGFFGDIENTPTGDKFAKYPLWIAHYGPPSPLTPKQWTTWTIWQYIAEYFLDANDPKIDANWFNGSLDDLKALCKQAPKVEVPAPTPVVPAPTVPAKKKCVLAFLIGS